MSLHRYHRTMKDLTRYSINFSRRQISYHDYFAGTHAPCVVSQNPTVTDYVRSLDPREHGREEEAQ